MTLKTLFTGACALALTAGLAACGGDDEAETEIAETQAELEAETTEATPAPEDPGAAAEAYLAENAEREGVRVTESGLQVETLEAGDGEAPGEGDILRFNYEMRTADGTVVDSSENLGMPMTVPGYEALQLPGLIEAVPQMRVGETALITMPPALAFGERGGGPIGPNEVIVFEIELVEAVSRDDEERLGELRAEEQARMAEIREAQMAEFEALKAENAEASEAFLAERRAEAGVQATETGLLYRPVEESGSGETPTAEDQVRVHYRGTLPSGEEFDSSYARGTPATFPLGGVIAGWTEGLQLMEVGDTYKFYIPADLAYGEGGTPGGPIGPNQALVFDVELLEIVGGPAGEEADGNAADAE